jgi:hypothetical protein
MFCWKFFDADGEHLGNSDSHPTIDAAVSWLQKQAEEDLPDVDVDADTAQLSVVKHVKIQRKVQLIGLPELVAAGAVSAPAPATTEAPAATPRRGRKLAVVPAPADIADQVPQSPAEPAVTELANVMDAGSEREPERRHFGGIEINTKPVCAADMTLLDNQKAAVFEAFRDYLLQTGRRASAMQLIAHAETKLGSAVSRYDIENIVMRAQEDSEFIEHDIQWHIVNDTYSLRTPILDHGQVPEPEPQTALTPEPELEPEAAPVPAPAAPQSPWEIVVDDCTVELRVGSQWSHQVYGSAATAGTVAGRLRSHMESGASGPASVAQRFVAGRALASAAVPEL